MPVHIGIDTINIVVAQLTHPRLCRLPGHSIILSQLINNRLQCERLVRRFRINKVFLHQPINGLLTGLHRHEDVHRHTIGLPFKPVHGFPFFRIFAVGLDGTPDYFTNIVLSTDHFHQSMIRLMTIPVVAFMGNRAIHGAVSFLIVDSRININRSAFCLSDKYLFVSSYDAPVLKDHDSKHRKRV